MRSILFLIVLLGVLSTANAQEIPSPVTVKIISDISTVKPGDSFNLGVFFEIDPGWHIYWKHPGDSGLPTQVEFRVPADYKTGELKWPSPQTFQNPKGGTDYGYEHTVLLWSKIEVPENAEISSMAVVEADISWLGCKEICIPGKAAFKYDIKLGEATKRVNVDLFSMWLKRTDQR